MKHMIITAARTFAILTGLMVLANSESSHQSDVSLDESSAPKTGLIIGLSIAGAIIVIAIVIAIVVGAIWFIIRHRAKKEIFRTEEPKDEIVARFYPTVRVKGPVNIDQL